MGSDPGQPAHACARPGALRLDLLEAFYSAAGQRIPAAERLEASAVPVPYRELLDHAQDMTGTLEAFTGDRLHLRPIAVRRNGHTLEREVLLARDSDARPVEFGAIRIHLDRLDAAQRDRVLEGVRPLGAILNETGAAYDCRLAALFRLPSDPVTREAFALSGPAVLYGRHNIIHDGRGDVLAEVVEILPPLDDGQRDAGVTG